LSLVPEKSRTQRAFLAFSSSVGFLVVGMLASFVATPVLVRSLGTERFGISRAMLDAFAYLALLEFGLPGASRPVIVAAVATRDPIVVAHTLRAIARSFLGPLLLKLVPSLLLVLLVPRFLKVPLELRPEATAAAALMVLGVVATPAPVFRHLLAAQQREYQNSLVQGLQNLAVILLAVAAAVLGYGLVGQAAVIVLTGTLSTLWLFLLAYPYFRTNVQRPDLEAHAQSQLRRLNWSIFLRSLCGRVALNSDRLFIAGLLGAGLVTRFHVSVRLVDVAGPFLFAIGNASWPALADIKLRDEKSLFDVRLKETSTLITLVGVLLLAPVIVVSAPFVQRWMGPGFFLGHRVICLAAINAILLALISFWDFCIGTVGDARTLLRPAVVAACVNVAVTIIATRLAGPIGPVLGTTVAVGGIMLGWEARLLSLELDVRAVPLLGSLLLAFGAGALYVAAGLLIVAPHCRPTWPSIVLCASGVSAGWAVISWFLLMDRDTRTRTRGRFSHLLGKLVRA